jgi:hypothetical protein
MREIKIVRTDRVSGFEEDIVDVHINGNKRKIRDGQTLVVLEKFPADVQIFARSKSTWEGRVIAKKDGSATVYAGITQAVVDRNGWGAVSNTPDGPALSGRAARIQEVMDSNAQWMAEKQVTAYVCYGISVLALVFVVWALSRGGGGWAVGWLVASIAVSVYGIVLQGKQPGQCAKCNAPTLTRTGSKERFMGVRSEQRIIRNQVTNENEQRTVTVSDMEVIEDWLCVTCDHSWTYKRYYVSE